MATEPMSVVDHHKLGEKIAEWTFHSGKRPKNFKDLKDALKGIIDDPWPSWIKDVAFVQGKDGVLIINLPPVEVLQAGLDSIPASGYRLPSFYENRIVQKKPPDTLDGNRILFHMKLGDYSISNCS